jgi:hypothetical protein
MSRLATRDCYRDTTSLDVAGLMLRAGTKASLDPRLAAHLLFAKSRALRLTFKC